MEFVAAGHEATEQSLIRVGQPMEGSATRPRQRTAPTATATRVVWRQQAAAGHGGRMRREEEDDGKGRDFAVRAFSLSSRRDSAGRRRRRMLRPRRRPAKSGADGITALSARARDGIMGGGNATAAANPPPAPPCRHLSTSPVNRKLPSILA
ncbi:hypothetical protein PAHAL_1G028300 [Panicum hallii]|uniref:Uncharacterized protein n=1 Tax=Panicum hallii TaxID=206008 RepID=A0A2S3GL34_9POAL|nr:hypothetical protein PAHAL_1G028300 [Panicum hallii]